MCEARMWQDLHLCAVKESMTLSFNRLGNRVREGYWYEISQFSGEGMIETKFGNLERRRMNGKEFGKLEEKNETQACRGERLNATWSCLNSRRPQVSLRVGFSLGSK